MSDLRIYSLRFDPICRCRSLSRDIEDRVKICRQQASATDEHAVDMRRIQDCLRVAGIYRAAIEKPDRPRLAAEPRFQRRADMNEHLDNFVARRLRAGSNRP